MKKILCFGFSLLFLGVGAQAAEFSFPSEIGSAAICLPSRTAENCTVKNCYISYIRLTCIDENGSELFADRQVYEKIVEGYDFHRGNFKDFEFMRLVLAMRAKGFRLEDSLFVRAPAPL